MKVLKFIISILIWPLFLYRGIKGNLISNTEQLSIPSVDQLANIPSGKRANRSIWYAALIVPTMLVEVYLVEFFMETGPDFISVTLIPLVIVLVILRYTYLRKVLKQYTLN